MIQNTPNNHGRSDQNIIIKVLSAPFLFLSLLFAHLNYLAILSGLENGVDSIVSKLLKNVIGFNVEFPVHGSGCILVSDTSTPLGKESAIYLASKGFTVFCGVEQLHAISQMRSKLSQSHNQRLLVPILLPDLCNQELLQNALQSILHHMETLDTADRFLIGIVNTSNARLDQMKPLEDVSVADWNGILSSNLVGPFSVISKFLPLLRISCGRIVNVSSFTSLTSSPMNGVFSCSKNALENATDTLRNEIFPFNISVSLIQPGALDDIQPLSAAAASSSTSSPQSPFSRRGNSSSIVGGAHKDLYSRISQTTRQIHSTITSSSAASTDITPDHRSHPISTSFTQALDHALFALIPKIKYSVGWDTKLTRWIRWAVSDRILDLVFQSLVKRNLIGQQRNT